MVFNSFHSKPLLQITSTIWANHHVNSCCWSNRGPNKWIWFTLVRVRNSKEIYPTREC